MVSSHPSSSEGHLRLAELALEAEDVQEAYRLAAQALFKSPLKSRLKGLESGATGRGCLSGLGPCEPEVRKGG